MILFSLIAAALIGLMYWFGYVDGKQRGYKKGKQDAEQAELNWWTKAESEVDEERVKIWREESKKGKEQEL